MDWAGHNLLLDVTRLNDEYVIPQILTQII